MEKIIRWSLGKLRTYRAQRKFVKLIKEEGNDFLNHLGFALVDMQEEYVEDFRPLEFSAMVSHQADLLRFAKMHGRPIVQIEYTGQGKTISPLREIVANSRHKPFVKSGNNGFSNAELGQYFNQENVRYLFLMGIYADDCVKATAEGALERGMSILSSDDAIMDDPIVRFNSYRFWYGQNGIYFNNHKEFITLANCISPATAKKYQTHNLLTANS